jgi:hypothetical protein
MRGPSIIMRYIGPASWLRGVWALRECIAGSVTCVRP